MHTPQREGLYWDACLSLSAMHTVPTQIPPQWSSVKTCVDVRPQVFYLKMKGDYHRYLAEFKTGSDRKDAAEHTLLAYKAAQVLFRLPSVYGQTRNGLSISADCG